MRVISFDLDEAQYQRLAALAAAHHEKMNAFFAARDLPQLGGYSVTEFARARLLVAIEFDEEVAAAIGKGQWPTAS